MLGIKCEDSVVVVKEIMGESKLSWLIHFSRNWEKTAMFQS